MSLLSFALYAAVAAFTFYLLIVGKALILPFAVAVVFWYLIATLAQTYGRAARWGIRVPRWLAMTLAVLTFIAAVWAFVALTRDNVVQVVNLAPIYQQNLERLMQSGLALVGIHKVPTLSQLMSRVDFGTLAGQMAASLTGFASNVGIILVYVIFLLIEQQSFAAKLEALIPDPGQRARVRRTLDRINGDVRAYIWVKTLLSVATGGISYAVMRAVGLDFAEFWAVVIFLLNYIPTVGSILGIVFPTLLALVQFDTLTPFFIVFISLGATQVIAGNVVEPRMMGKTLNLSPLVILVSLALWGSIWGIVGMFLGVPLTVIAMIVMAQFKVSRPIAIMLSSDGSIVEADRDTGPESA